LIPFVGHFWRRLWWVWGQNIRTLFELWI